MRINIPQRLNARVLRVKTNYMPTNHPIDCTAKTKTIEPSEAENTKIRKEGTK